MCKHCENEFRRVLGAACGVALRELDVAIEELDRSVSRMESEAAPPAPRMSEGYHCDRCGFSEANRDGSYCEYCDGAPPQTPQMTYLVNAFSLNMLANPHGAELRVLRTIGPEEYLQRGFVNAIGHPSTAAIAAADLAKRGVFAPPAERLTISLNRGDTLVVCQYSGPRLPEGATELPEGAKLEWLVVHIDDQD